MVQKYYSVYNDINVNVKWHVLVRAKLILVGSFTTRVHMKVPRTLH